MISTAWTLPLKAGKCSRSLGRSASPELSSKRVTVMDDIDDKLRVFSISDKRLLASINAQY